MNETQNKFPWMRDIPEGWASFRLKYVSTLKGRVGWQNLRAEEYTDEGPYLVTSEHFHQDTVDWERCYHVTQERYKMAPEIQLRPHDLLMMKDGAAMGKLAYIDELPGEACLNSHLLLFRPLKNRYFPRYLYYVLASRSFQSYVWMRGTGSTFLGVSQQSISEYPVALPSLSTQQKIAGLLDRKTTTIDALIASKQRLIQVLEEKRTALINQAVTKGLHPNVPMKDSGIPWIGKIPKQWGIKRARFIFKQLDRPIREEDGVVTAFRDGQVTLRENRRVEGFTFAIQEVGYQGVRVGDLVIHSMDAFAGAIGVSESDGKSTPEYVVCQPLDSRTNNHYYAALLRWMAKQNYIFVICPSVRERAPRFRFSTFKDVELPVPPPNEQDAIAKFILQVPAQINPILEKLRKQVDTIREYRQALITNAVTGKLDLTKLKQVSEDTTGRKRLDLK